MQRIEYTLKKKDEVIDFLGDTHEDSILQATEKLDEVIEDIARKKRAWFHMGDWMNAIQSNDPKFMYGHQRTPLTLKQKDNAVKRFKRIARLGIGGLQGNHERWLHRTGDFAESICKDLGIPYGTFTAQIIFKYKGDVKFRVYAHHSVWQFKSNAKDAEQADANIKAAIKMKLKHKLGDCAVMLCANAHLLKVVAPVKELYLCDENGGLKQKYSHTEPMDYAAQYIPPDRRWYGCTGSFEKLYANGLSGFAEFVGCDPRELGYIKLHVQDCKPVLLEPVII